MLSRLRAPALTFAALIGAAALFANFGHAHLEGRAAVPVGSVTDVDGNVYPLVRIGRQEWLGAELRTTRLRDGGPVPGVFAYGGDEAQVATWGRLYTFEATQQGDRLCPEGLRMPMDEDWAALEATLGMSEAARGEMGWRPAEGAVGLKAIDAGWPWEQERAGRLNATGFGARPAGVRSAEGAFVGRGSYANWWSSTPATQDGRAFNRSLVFGAMHPGRSRIYRNIIDARWAFSVRCMRDLP